LRPGISESLDGHHQNVVNRKFLGGSAKIGYTPDAMVVHPPFSAPESIDYPISPLAES